MGMKAPAAPCRAICDSGSFTLIFQQLITETFVLGVFLQKKMGKGDSLPTFWQAMEYIKYGGQCGWLVRDTLSF